MRWFMWYGLSDGSHYVLFCNLEVDFTMEMQINEINVTRWEKRGYGLSEMIDIEMMT